MSKKWFLNYFFKSMNLLVRVFMVILVMFAVSLYLFSSNEALYDYNLVLFLIDVMSLYIFVFCLLPWFLDRNLFVPFSDFSAMAFFFLMLSVWGGVRRGPYYLVSRKQSKAINQQTVNNE